MCFAAYLMICRCRQQRTCIELGGKSRAGCEETLKVQGARCCECECGNLGIRCLKRQLEERERERETLSLISYKRLTHTHTHKHVETQQN